MTEFWATAVTCIIFFFALYGFLRAISDAVRVFRWFGKKMNGPTLLQQRHEELRERVEGHLSRVRMEVPPPTPEQLFDAGEGPEPEYNFDDYRGRLDKVINTK